ncbi:alpha/beta fold hydrolase [Angustibacter luteus]|uniref:Alpha/beta fold hydrolase n=1 Tax=Angustibacter luteus TaxID=658456 RepID=A0ABW1JF11_9ACTN
MRSPSKAVLGIGAGLAAAGVGAALGLAAERWTAGRVAGTGEGEAYGSLRGSPTRVTADDGTQLHVEVDELDVDGALPSGDAGSDAPASEVTVVFSHGFCLNQDIWHFQRQWLRGRYRMVFWDQRGHGRSGTGPSGHYTVDQCGADLRAVIDAVAPTGPLVLVGHSMGGMTVMALAGEQPDLIRERIVGVALVATSSGGLADVSWGLTGSVSKVAHKVAPVALVGLTRTPRLVDRTRRIGSDLEQFVVKRYSYASPVPPELVRFTAAMIAATPIDVVSGFLPGFDLHDKAEALAALDGIEALVLSGEEDLLTPVEHSDAIVRRLPGAEHVLVPDAGHMVMLEHPDVVNLHLGDLLERADRAVGRGRRGRRLRRPRRA